MTRLKRLAPWRKQPRLAGAKAPFALPDLVAHRRHDATTTVGVLVYSGVATTEVGGPSQRLAHGLGADLVHVGLSTEAVVGVEPVRSVHVDVTVSECPHVDVVVVPGGLGWRRIASDERAMTWLAQATTNADGILTISTGSLILGSAGRLAGHSATGHWLARDSLAALGATVSTDRSVHSEDDRLVTTSGARAALDVCDSLAERLRWGP